MRRKNNRMSMDHVAISFPDYIGVEWKPRAPLVASSIFRYAVSDYDRQRYSKPEYLSNFRWTYTSVTVVDYLVSNLMLFIESIVHRSSRLISLNHCINSLLTADLGRGHYG